MGATCFLGVDNSSGLCRVCHMCNTLPSVKRDLDCEAGMAVCSDIAEFVFDYCTRLRLWLRKAWALNNRDKEFCL